ncbi:MAG: hypothetical protein KBG72_13965, partial [Agrobacterium sp.]|nr:hypothetical protein [Agrobacterium sp.]
MTNDIPGQPEDVRTAERVSELIRAGQHADALTMLVRDFGKGTPSKALFQEAAAALVATVMGEGLPATLPEAQKTAFLQTLILQPSSEAEPAALHFQIASAHSGGRPGVLERMAGVLRPVLAGLWAQGCRDRSFLVMALLLRSSLGETIGRSALRQWHHELLPHFTSAELTIPYNWMFDRKSFSANVDDVRAFIRNVPGAELVRSLQPWQIVQLHWITGGTDIDPLLPQLMPAADPATGSAGRSLALRAAALGLGPAPAGWEAQAVRWTALRDPQEQARFRPSALARLESRPIQALQAAVAVAARKAPILHLGRRRPRIAVCVSGQLRGWQQALPSWRKGLLQNADCRFFVHTWQNIGRSGAEYFRAYLPFAGTAFCTAWREQAQRAGMEAMTALFPALFSALRNGGRVRPAALAEAYGTDHVVVEDETAPAFAGWSNSQKMHYKLEAAHKLAADSGEDFDLVLRLRPDKETGLAAFSWSDLIAAAREPAIFADISFGFHYGFPMIGDQVAIGLPDAMAVYTDTFQIAPRLQADDFYRCKDGFVGHKSLALTLWHAGIAVRRLPVKMGRLLEAATMG